MTLHIIAIKLYPCYRFFDHGRYWSTSWAQVQLTKGTIGLAQFALMALEMYQRSMDRERAFLEQN